MALQPQNQLHCAPTNGDHTRIVVLLFSTTCHEAARALLLSEDAAARFQAFGMQMRSFSMIGLLVAWRVFDPVFDSIFGLSLKVLYPTQGYGS